MGLLKNVNQSLFEYFNIVINQKWAIEILLLYDANQGKESK